MPKVLIVDDDPAMTLALAIRLRAAAFEVLTSNSAHEASPIAVRQRPDVILLDIDMPSFSGLEFHECLRNSERARTIPVIYISGVDSDTYRRVALQQGARGFVSKPFDMPKLLAVIQAAIGTSGATLASA